MKKSKKCVPNSAFFHNKSKVGCVKKRCSANLPDADADADSDGDSDNVCMKETNNDSVAMLMVVF